MQLDKQTLLTPVSPAFDKQAPSTDESTLPIIQLDKQAPIIPPFPINQQDKQSTLPPLQLDNQAPELVPLVESESSKISPALSPLASDRSTLSTLNVKTPSVQVINQQNDVSSSSYPDSLTSNTFKPIKENKSFDSLNIVKLDERIEDKTSHKSIDYRVVDGQTIHIDVHSMSPSSLAPSVELPRRCRLVRADKSVPYGFDLSLIKEDGGVKYMAKNISLNSPAHNSGLVDGDYILEVNGDCVEGLDKDAVIAKIFYDIRQVDLLVARDYRPYLENKPNYIINNNNRNRRGSLPSGNRTRSSSVMYSSERKCCSYFR